MTGHAERVAQLEAENAVLRSKLRDRTPSSIDPDYLYDTPTLACALGVSKRTIDLWSREPDGPKVTRTHTNAPRKYRGIDVLHALDRAREE